ncbi:MAG: DNA translocase FtsK [Proteocatella sp.]
MADKKNPIGTNKNTVKPKIKKSTSAPKKTVKKTPSKSVNSSKKSSKKKVEDFRKQNIIALIMVVLGMIMTLSITTNAMGFVGKAVKAIMLGQFAKLSILISLTMLIIGAVRLTYSSKFELSDISPIMILLLSIATMMFYGAMNLEIVLGGKLNFNTIKIIYVNSVAGVNIGIWPYLLTYFMNKLIGKSGIYIIALAIYAFVGIYYFKWSPEKIGRASGSFIKKGTAVVKTAKQKAVDYVVEDEDDEQPKKVKVDKKNKSSILKKPEVLEENKIPKKSGPYDFLEKFYVDGDSKELPTYNNEKINNKISDEDIEIIDIEKAEILDFEDNEVKLFESEKNANEDRIMNLSKAEFNFGNTIRYDRNFLSVKKSVSVSDDIIDEREAFIKNQNEKENPEKLEKYVLPSLVLLKDYKVKPKDQNKQLKNSTKLEETLALYGIEAKVVNVSVGPTITRYELHPKAGIKLSKIMGLADDLALALAAVAPIRIEAPIPGTSLIGIELPNVETDMVSFKSVVESKEFIEAKSKLSFVLGKDVSGKPMISDVSKMPHMLVAGSTGSGKSVCINALICSILFKSTPDEVKFIMIDPKMVELSIYNDIPHLLIPVVTDMKRAPYALSWAVNEMNNRYKLFAENRVRDLDSYNALNSIDEKLPRIVIIVDELADLMMVSPNEVEDAICRLAQMARACGMHLVLATQRPSVDVITGLIKSNIPSRIAFAVSSQVDSRTILDSVGAEKLIGRGDMLYSPQGASKAQRIQGAFITDKEVKSVVDFVSNQFPKNHREFANLIEETMNSKENEKKEKESDPLIDEVIEFAQQNGQISTSLVQRKFRLGYNRASRIIDEMEERGICGPIDGAKPRKVYPRQIEISE